MDSIIKINAEREERGTVLKESFHNAPYKLTHYGSAKAQDHLEMIVMSASPGILDRDSLLMDVHVKEDAYLKLFTQSFNKLHPMQYGASQNIDVRLAKGSVFQYVPHPVTPFKDSIFKTVNQIYMDADSTLIWGDIISAGRIYMNERFVFTKLHSITKIFKDGALNFMDNQCLLPKEQPIEDLLFFEGYTHQATLLFSGPYAKDLKVELDEILTAEYADVMFGFTQCAEDTVLLRAMGSDGELLYNFLGMLAQMCWVFTQDQIQVQRTKSSIEQADPTTHVVAKADKPRAKTKPAMEKKRAKKKQPNSKRIDVL